MNKTVQSVINNAMGYYYEWTITSSSCSSPLVGVLNSGYITNNPEILSQTITTIPDECELTAQLTVYYDTETICEVVTFNLNTNNIDDYFHWTCVPLNDGYGCNMVIGLPTDENYFNSYDECVNCQTCSCNPNNNNQTCPCTIDITYDCVTGIMAVINNSVNTDCISITIGEIYKNGELLYSGSNTPIITGNSITFPVVLPNGSYYMSVNFIATDTIGNTCNYTETILVDCGYGETSNIACCTPIVNDPNNQNIGNVNGIDLYIVDISNINPLQDLFIDFGYNTVADQIYVYRGIKAEIDITTNPTTDLVASTPPCGDLSSCHNYSPCVSNVDGAVVEGFWTGNGIYNNISNTGTNNQSISVRNSLFPTWSSSLINNNIGTHNSSSMLPNINGGGILKGQGRLTINGGSYSNASNKLTIAVKNNGSTCTCNTYINSTAYKFQLICPDCEPSNLTLLCEEEFVANNTSGANLNNGEYTDFTIDITDNVCNANNIYFAIDYDNVNVVDKIKVFYNNVVAAETPYIGSTCLDTQNNNILLEACDGISTTLNSQCYQQGFYINTNLSPDSAKNTNPTSVTPIPLLTPTHFSTNDGGSGRLIVDIPYITGIDNVVIRYINNSDNSCSTYWKTMLRCLDCPIVETCCLNTLISPVELIDTESLFILTIDSIEHNVSFTYEAGDTVVQLINEINTAISSTGVNLEIVETATGLQNNYNCSSPNTNLEYTLLKINYPCNSTIQIDFEFTTDYNTSVNNTDNLITINELNHICTLNQIESPTCSELLVCNPLTITTESCCVIIEDHPYKVVYKIEQDNNHCIESLADLNITASSGVEVYFLNEGDIPLPEQTSCRTLSAVDTTASKYIIVFLTLTDVYNIQFECCGTNYVLTQTDVVLLQPTIHPPVINNFCEGQTVDLYFTDNLAGTIYFVVDPTILTNIGLTLDADGHLTGTILAGSAGTHVIEVYGEFGTCTSVSILYTITITDCGGLPYAEVDVNFGDNGGTYVNWDYEANNGGAKVVVNGGYGVYSSYLTDIEYESIFVTKKNYVNDTIYNNPVSNYSQPYMPFSYLDGNTEYLYDTSVLPMPAPLTYTANPVPEPITGGCGLLPDPYDSLLQVNLGGNTLTSFSDRYDCFLLPAKYSTVGITSNAACIFNSDGSTADSLQYPIGTTIYSVVILQNDKYGGIPQIIPINYTRSITDSVLDFKAQFVTILNTALSSMDFTQRNNGVDTTLVAYDGNPANATVTTFGFEGEIWENAPQIIHVNWVSPNWTYDVNGGLIGYHQALNNNVKGCNSTTCTSCIGCPDCVEEPAYTYVHFPRGFFYSICYTVKNNNICNAGNNEVIQAIKHLVVAINPYNNTLTYTIRNAAPSNGVFDSRRYRSSTNCTGISQYDCRQQSNELDNSGNLIYTTC